MFRHRIVGEYDVVFQPGHLDKAFQADWTSVVLVLEEFFEAALVDEMVTGPRGLN